MANAATLANTVALVTGGSRGLGLEMATALGEAGATVVVADMAADRAEKGVLKRGWTRASTGREGSIRPRESARWRQPSSAPSRILGASTSW